TAAPKPATVDNGPVGGVVQIAAYTSESAAVAGWNRLVQGHEMLKGMNHRIVSAKIDLGTVYRLQLVTNAGGGSGLCDRLKADGLPWSTVRATDGGMIPAIFGLSGLTLTDDERAFFRDSDPAGYILFGRNVESRQQLRALTDDLRALHGRDDLFISIDQEGGRVARMKPPVWPKYPAGEPFARLYDAAPSSAIA
ncbi:hypothetical protein E4T56_gene2275, partial [Termitomyces sp. T112]